MLFPGALAGANAPEALKNALRLDIDMKARRGTAGGHRGKPKRENRGPPSTRQAQTSTPTILRASTPVVTTLFNPDQPRQHPQAHQRLYEPNSSPSSPPGPVLSKRIVPQPLKTAVEQKPGVYEWKLINAQLQFCPEPSAIAGWAEITTYQVIGVVGLEGVGKSTVLSLLAGHTFNRPISQAKFPIQTLDDKINGRHQTNGIDVFITENNVVLLDCQPLLSSSLLNDQIQKKESPKFGALPLDQQIEISSLQLLVFLFSVCHHVLVVSDKAIDNELWRLMQCAELLKHHVPNISGELTEHCARAIFVGNKLSRPAEVQAQVQKLQECFTRSIYVAAEDEKDIHRFIFPNLLDRSRERMNLKVHFVETPKALFKVGAFQALKKYMIQLPKTSLTQKKTHLLTFKEWMQNAARIYDGLRKSNSMIDYTRLLQKMTHK
ncbi:SMG9 isoform X2 [Thraustotheca clavata]|uniref:SMG9 isoform X2 n=1 Tax=Thraustotheca clavata TaxID=74557 RepID=A0A1V9ZGU2_9STRA|nr:SMG9 isoform X2 [Thraustotheca clavata]